MGMASCHVDHPGRGIRRLDRGRLVHDPVRDHARPCCQLQHGAVTDGRTDPLEHLRIGLLIRAHEVRIPPRIAVPEALFLHAFSLFRLVISNQSLLRSGQNVKPHLVFCRKNRSGAAPRLPAGSGQPGPALHLRYERDGVKMVPAPELSLRGRFAPVAISGRHCRPVPAADKRYAPKYGV